MSDDQRATLPRYRVRWCEKHMAHNPIETYFWDVSSLGTAEAWADHANRVHPDLHFWAEEALSHE